MKMYEVFFMIPALVGVGWLVRLLLTRDSRRRALLDAYAERSKQLRLDRELGNVTIEDASGLSMMFRPNSVLSASLDVKCVGHSKANLRDVAGRATVGGLVAGPLGAAVGAVTGARSDHQLISNIQVHVVGKDGSHRTIQFHSGKPSTEAELADKLQEARSAVARLSAAASRHDK